MSSDKVVVIGHRSHAKVVCELLSQNSSYEIIGCIRMSSEAPLVPDDSILGDEGIVPRLVDDGVLNVALGVGDNLERLRMAWVATTSGLEFVKMISRHAVISDTSELGQGILVMPCAVVNNDSRVGDFSIINSGAIVEHDCLIGEAVHIGPGSILCGSVIIEDQVLVGAGATILPFIRVGEGAIIGAGAVVTKNVPAGETVIGVPARLRP